MGEGSGGAKPLTSWCQEAERPGEEPGKEMYPASSHPQ